MTAEVSEAGRDASEVGKPRRTLRMVLLIVAGVVVLAVYWMYSYNPLAQSWHQVPGGEWGSYVGSSSGVEAHYTTTD